ncbi:hypothetical protein [uncultured Kordia sp.]|uniref:hypothetical protein n=1 Tax=uncultured Kordia sp. TaxID=507699 RepID=UPI002636C778|nr:hypothetical protein [uncultured Kordia sp.]
MKKNNYNGIAFSYEKTDLNLLLVKFVGRSFSGSKGNEQGEFIYESLYELFQKLNLNDFKGIIIDFTNLEYTFGNYIFNTITLIHTLNFPKAIAYSDKCLNLIDNRPNLFFNGMKSAVEFLTTKE